MRFSLFVEVNSLSGTPFRFPTWNSKTVMACWRRSRDHDMEFDAHENKTAPRPSYPGRGSLPPIRAANAGRQKSRGQVSLALCGRPLPETFSLLFDFAMMTWQRNIGLPASITTRSCERCETLGEHGDGRAARTGCPLTGIKLPSRGAWFARRDDPVAEVARGSSRSGNGLFE
jgi:hypothetical protein